MQEQAITFSFAENWRSYVDTVNEDSVNSYCCGNRN
jgi:hypothetical protein